MANSTLTPIFPLNKVIGTFLAQAQGQLELNAATQAVFPREIYPGFASVNEYRRVTGQWYAKGEGHKSFMTHLVTKGTDGVSAVFQYADYLRFVDIGVGKGTKAAQVERGRKARFKTRYTTHWDRKAGRSHRPAIMMEIRHFASRTLKYLVDYYGYQGEAQIMSMFDDKGVLVFNSDEPMPRAKG